MKNKENRRNKLNQYIVFSYVKLEVTMGCGEYSRYQFLPENKVLMSHFPRITVLCPSIIVIGA